MKTLIAIPCMDMVHTDFMRSCLGMKLEGEVQYTFSQASLIYDGRNTLAKIAVNNGFDRVLWLDSDMQFGPDLFRALSADLDEGREIVSALYFSRKPPIKPVAYKTCRINAAGIPEAESFRDFPPAEIFPVAACGFGAVMMTTELLRRVQDRFGLPFSPAYGFGEDLSFCMRVSELGETVWCDSRIRPGHVGTCVYDESAFRAQTGHEEKEEKHD